MINQATTSVPKACHQCPPTNSQDRPIAWVPRRPSTTSASMLTANRTPTWMPKPGFVHKL
jgi:hypothetical protein